MNRLYSSFDIDKLDRVDFREFVACIRILRLATEKPVDKLMALFPIFDLDDENVLSFQDVTKLLQTCSVTADEKSRMLVFANELMDSSGLNDTHDTTNAAAMRTGWSQIHRASYTVYMYIYYTMHSF